MQLHCGLGGNDKWLNGVPTKLVVFYWMMLNLTIVASALGALGLKPSSHRSKTFSLPTYSQAGLNVC